MNLRVSVASVTQPGFSAAGVSLLLDVFTPGAAELRIKTLTLGQNQFKNVVAVCRGFRLDERAVDCPQGLLRRPGQPDLPVSVNYAFRSKQLKLALADVEAGNLLALIPGLQQAQPSAHLALNLLFDPGQVTLNLTLKNMKFASADGNLAGEGIAGVLSLSAKKQGDKQGDNWQWQAAVDWQQGELYRAPWYRKAATRLTASGDASTAVLTVADANLMLDGIGQASGKLGFDRSAGKLLGWQFTTDKLDLATAMKELILPWLDSAAMPQFQASGGIRLAMASDAQGLVSGALRLENALIADSNGSYTLRGVNADLPWQRGTTSEATLSAQSGLLGKLKLGDFKVPLRVLDNGFVISDLTIPMLDGKLFVSDFSARKEAESAGGAVDWQGNFVGSVTGISMPKLSAALGLPIMTGQVTATIPGAHYRNHELSFDGELALNVFDGKVTARKVKLIEPLSATQRVIADVDVKNIDLAMLTQTFSFGSILGRFDGHVSGLEMLGWTPLRFDARMQSSPGDYPKLLSRSALNDISALGGFAGQVAVQTSPIRFFNTFSYDRIGLGCVLKEGVCLLNGLGAQNGGEVLVQGSGIPRVTVIGYNPRIDWPLLVSRLKSVTAGKSTAVVE